MSDKRYPKEIILKDRKEVILKILEQKDKDKLLDFYKSMDLSFKWYLKEDPSDSAVLEKWLKRQKQGRAFAIIALYNNEIVGHACLLKRLYGARKHIGRLRIMVAREFSHKQLGTWMIFDLTKRAMEMGLERIRIDFVVGIDDYAINSVRKLDFIKEGLLKDYIQDENGNYHDYQIMVKQLHNGWSDF